MTRTADQTYAEYLNDMEQLAANVRGMPTQTDDFLNALADACEHRNFHRDEHEMRYSLAGSEVAKRIRNREFRHPRYGLQTPEQVAGAIQDVIHAHDIADKHIGGAVLSIIAHETITCYDNPVDRSA